MEDLARNEAWPNSLGETLELLHETLGPSGSLEELMRDISRKAQERGLTPEILETILHES